MLRKRDEQGVYQAVERAQVEKFGKTSVPYVPVPAGLYASDRDEWFHFQGHSHGGTGCGSAHNPFLILSCFPF